MQSLFDLLTYTKGIEYIIAVSFLVVFVWFWKFAKGGEMVTVAVEREERVRVPGMLENLIGGFLLPREYFYHQGHTWVKPVEGDVVAIGLDDFSQKLVGRIEGIKVPSVGTLLKQGEKGLSVIANSIPVDLLAPVDGEVIAVNPALQETPGKINSDPYGEGWLVKVRTPRFRANRSGLFSGELAKMWLDEVRGRLMTRLSPALGTVALDAGPAVSGIAERVAGEKWNDLVKEFLMVE
ncbi:MAG: glycine cleavage system protein H [Proteobacteria bacterium]|nr:glycine cleavage system protein H [Pseudomonadota bacterium]